MSMSALGRPRLLSRSENMVAKPPTWGGGSGSAELRFSWTIAEDDLDDDGVAIAANSLSLNGGAIQGRGKVDAMLSHPALTARPAHRVDAVRPALLEDPGALAGSGHTVGVFFDEVLNPQSVPAADAFHHLRFGHGRGDAKDLGRIDPSWGGGVVSRAPVPPGGAAPSVAYEPPLQHADALRDDVGNAVARLTTTSSGSAAARRAARTVGRRRRVIVPSPVSPRAAVRCLHARCGASANCLSQRNCAPARNASLAHAFWTARRRATMVKWKWTFGLMSHPHCSRAFENSAAASFERLIDARNRALVAAAYDALLRRSELTALAVGDVIEEVDGSASLLVRCGKGGEPFVRRGRAPHRGRRRQRVGLRSGDAGGSVLGRRSISTRTIWRSGTRRKGSRAASGRASATGG